MLFRSDPSDFKLKLRILVSDKFGPVDKPPEMKLAHRKPKERGVNLLSAGTPIGDRQYEYESPIFMPPRGDEYLGLLHRTVQSAMLTQPDWVDVCFVREAGSLARDPIVRLSCEEGVSCQVARDDLGWAKPCPSRSSQPSSVSLLSVAFAQALATRPETGWVVPSLETLRKQEAARQNPAFTEFILTSGPLAALSKADRLTYTIRVNGTPVYIDGMPPETNALPFNAATGLRLSFGLENLDFSGLDAGYEHIEVTLQFASGEQRIRRAAIQLRYIALRPMPETAVTGDTSLGLRSRAEYHRGWSEDIYEIFLLSTSKTADAVERKRRIDAGKLVLDGDTVVGVVRPQLGNNPSYGVVLGIARPSGQVKFTFDDAKSRTLCGALVRMSAKSPLVSGAALRRSIDNRNLSITCNAF